MSKTLSAEAIGTLREAIVGFKKSIVYKDIVEPRDSVFARFQPLFSPEHVKQITTEEFHDFLLFKNNLHWTGLQRLGPRICADIKKLRKGLGILVEETEPIAERLDKAIGLVPGMGKNIATAILIILCPDRYGVWNNRSEAKMKELGLWPDFERGERFGSRYIKVNQILLELCTTLQLDLWALDALWWYLDREEPREVPPGGTDTQTITTILDSGQKFGLERHLHEFMRDNWKHIELGRNWAIYQEPGDEEAGYEYQCGSVGRIDLLAKHRRKSHWLVIELKRNETSDQTVGQVLRYIGWVKKHLAEPGEEVHGMIVCREVDNLLLYALSTVQNVEIRRYQVEFKLGNPESLSSLIQEDTE